MKKVYIILERVKIKTEPECKCDACIKQMIFERSNLEEYETKELAIEELKKFSSGVYKIEEIYII